MTAPQVTPPPETTPNKYGGDPVAFDVTMQAWLTWMAASVPEENAMAVWMNERASYVESGAAAAGGIAAATAVVMALAASASVAKDQAIAAWAASMYPAETLPAISKSIHSGTVVKGIIYDTSKDSDGGAWRKRCTDKSWYTEALGGVAWLGQASTAAAAWAGAGSVTGSYFQNTTDGKYYTLGASSPAVVECWRGNVRECPEQPLAVAQNAPQARVVVYDSTQVGVPMWRVFLYPGKTINSIAMRGGKLLVATTTGLFVEDLIADSIGKAEKYTTTTIPAIINSIVRDVSVTVLDGAPVDPATGLPMLTIAMATSAGVSVARQDGVVVHSSQLDDTRSCDIRDDILYLSCRYGIDSLSRFQKLAGITANWISSPFALTQKEQISIVATKTHLAHSLGFDVADKRLGLSKLNQSNPAGGLFAVITNAYNTGWMVGDIRGAYLADTTAETITGSDELVTNGAFSDSSNWTLSGTGWSISAGVATHMGAVAGYLDQTISGLIVGKKYLLLADVTGAIVFDTGSGVNVTLSVGLQGMSTFTANNTTLHLFSNSPSSIDNISVKLADPDRSVKNNGLIVNGSFTKTAVATGSQLVGYSIASVGAYMEQPYSANLDFASGDLGFLVALKEGANSAVETLFERAYYTAGAYSGARFGCTVDAAGKLKFSVNDGTNSASITTTNAINTSIWLTPVFVGSVAGFLVIRQNGIDLATPVSRSAVGSLTNTSAVFRAFLDVSGANGLTNGTMALLRPSATAPSNDQLAHVGRTELPLFQPGAQCTLAGTTSGVTGLSYSETTGVLDVFTAGYRSGFVDLLRVDSQVSPVGTITGGSSESSARLIAGSTGAYFYQPAMLLRDELRRKDEARKALGKVPVFFDFDAASFTSPTTSGSAALTASSIVGTPYVGMGITGTGIPAGTTLIAISGTAYTMSANATVTNAGAVAIAQSSFTLQQGYTTKAVYSAGALKRLGASKDYLTANDGFRETVNFGTSPGSAAWISIMAIRSN